MYTKLIWLFCFVLVLSIAGNVSADLVGYWKFDEGYGNKAYDSSEYGNDGTIDGIPHWVTSRLGTALYFDGDRSFVEIPHSESLSITGQITIEAWTNMTAGSNRSGFIVKKGLSYLLWEHNANVIIWFAAEIEGCRFESPQAGEWHHIAATFDGTIYKCYVDGELSSELDWGAVRTIPENEFPVYIGGEPGGSHFDGIIDEVKIYDHALSEGEIRSTTGLSGSRQDSGPDSGQDSKPDSAQASKPDPGQASKPDPADGAFISNLWVPFSWKAGDFAVSHDVYISDNYDDVASGAGDTFRGNLDLNTTYYIAGIQGYAYPDGLDLDTTYYWRIDEVNNADPNSPWKGDVWSFTVPPKNASNPNPPDGAEFVYVGEDTVFSWTPGLGAERHTVYFGNSFNDVNDATGGVPQLDATYSPGVLDYGMVVFWRVDEFDLFDTFKGEVWCFTTPLAVGNPLPANGAQDVKLTTTLSWAPAASISLQELYFGTDKDTVRNADMNSPEYKGSKESNNGVYNPGMLDWDTTYYWRVDGVHNWIGLYEGPLWSFTTAKFITVDDFEDYNVAYNEIWWAWKDGFGYAAHDNEPAYPGNGTGSIVGDEATWSFTEETIVHSGKQSMPMFYDNNKNGYSYYSQAELTLDYPRDWTEQDVSNLIIWFRGIVSNDAERLYVSLSNKTGGPVVVYYDDPAATQIDTWTEWEIPLQDFADQGIDLSDVNAIAIGVGTQGNNNTPGGAGKIYIDDIRLYRSEIDAAK